MLRNGFLLLLCLILVPISFAALALAQSAGDTKVVADQATLNPISDEELQLLRQNIRSQRKQIVAANLPLTDAEATKFWPLYDKYVAETIKLNDTRYVLIKDYAKNYETMTDAQADSFIKRWVASDEAVSQLRSKWIPEFERVITAKKTAMFFQIDRRTGLMVDLQLASQIPLVKP